MTLPPLAKLGGLTLLDPIGAGGQATVFRARRADGMLVALKVIQSRGGASGERARREARALSHLSHPCLPRCTSLLEDPDGAWLALELELVEGRSLDVAARHLDLEARRRALRDVASALAHLHAHDVVHRDVKPSNVIVDPGFGEAAGAMPCKLVDLGIAVATNNPSPLTDHGHPGTVPFMAPEALDAIGFPAPQGRPTLDVFAFGVTAWIVLRGRHPLGLPLDATTIDFVRGYSEHLGAEQLFLPPEDLDDPFERVVASCLRLRADERPADGAALLALIDEALCLPEEAARPRTRSRPPRATGAARPAHGEQCTSLGGPVGIPAAPPPRPHASRASIVAGLIVAGVLLLAVLAVGLAGSAVRGLISSPSPAESAAPSAPVVSPPGQSAAVAAQRLSSGPAPLEASMLEWSQVGESNVRNSTALGCETKVLAAWLRVRCAHRPGEILQIGGPPEAGAAVAVDSAATTLFVPLRDRDHHFQFDWAGGRGRRTLHVVGRPVRHRVIQSQGEFSAP